MYRKVSPMIPVRWILQFTLDERRNCGLRASVTCARPPGYRWHKQALSRPAWTWPHSLPLGSSLPGLRSFSLGPWGKFLWRNLFLLYNSYRTRSPSISHLLPLLLRGPAVTTPFRPVLTLWPPRPCDQESSLSLAPFSSFKFPWSLQ